MTLSSKRAEYIALASLVLSGLFFVIALLLGRYSGFYAVTEAAWLNLAAVLIWFILLIQFHQRSLAEQEKLDMGQVTAKGDATTIFQTKAEGHTLLAVAQRRLEVLEKWFIPAFGIIIAAYQIAIGFYLYKTIPFEADVQFKQPLVCAVAMASIAFLSFLLSRYATGMSQQEKWKPLRAGGSFFLGITVICFAMAVGLALWQFKIFAVARTINYIIPVVMIVIGFETVMNVIFDIYRPRLKGQYSRSAFDSRLLGIINEPGKIFRTAAGAIDYQFGFKVSDTWFYKLLEKAIIPLVLLSALILYAMSCFVIVAPDEQAVVEHFGSPVDVKTGEKRILTPGLAFKWPWPIDIAYKYPVEKIAQLNIGFIPKLDKDGYPEQGPRLWGKSHYEAEYNLLVASSQDVAAGNESGAVPVSLVMAAVPVQYKVKDIYSYLYNHDKPEKILEAICYRELAKFAASSRIEVDKEEDLSQSLLGAGRGPAREILSERIQAAADEAELGVKVVFVGLQGLHPPPDVAADYQQVVGAVQKKQAEILNAHAQRNLQLSELAGSVDDANKLYSLVGEYQKAQSAKDEKKIEDVEAKLDSAFANASGDIFEKLRNSQSYAYEKSVLAEATGLRFASQLKAYQAAPDYFMKQQRLDVLEKGLENIRKFVVVADANDTQVFIVDVQEKLTPSLYDLGGLEETTEK